MLSVNPKGAKFEDTTEEPSRARLAAFEHLKLPWYPNSTALF